VENNVLRGTQGTDDEAKAGVDDIEQEGPKG